MRNHIVSCGHYNKSLGIMKSPRARAFAIGDFFIKTKIAQTEGNKSLVKRVKIGKIAIFTSLVLARYRSGRKVIVCARTLII